MLVIAATNKHNKNIVKNKLHIEQLFYNYFTIFIHAITPCVHIPTIHEVQVL